MKNHSFCISLMLSSTMFAMMISSNAHSQDASYNYIATEHILNSGGTGVKSVQYYDSFGRPTLEASGGVNTTGNYVYTMTDYDGLGNVSRLWLPSVGGSSPNYIDSQSFASFSNGTYGSTDAVSDFTYDALGRVTFISTAGSECRSLGKGVTKEYFTNEENSVRKIELQNGLPVVSTTSYYPAGSLLGISTIDEDEHEMDVYRDVAGNIVLERRYDGGSEPNDTYYIYEHGLLRAVVPMICIKRGYTYYSYRYEYDSYGRCIQKDLPGHISTNYWYGRHGRLSFLKDKRLDNANQYRFFLYDALGRLVVQGRTGTLITDREYEAMVVPGSSDPALCQTGYSQTSNTHITDCVLEQVNYYDNYTCLQTPLFLSSGITSYSSSFNNSYSQSFPTAQILFDMSGTPLLSVLSYDWQGRCIETLSTYLEDVTLKTQFKHSYTGRTTSTTRSLYKSGQLLHSVIDSIRYDFGSDLPIMELLSADGSPFVTVSSVEYDDLGRINSRLDFNGLITEEYDYNLLGNLTRHQAFDSHDQNTYLFDEKLFYASSPNDHPCYNGNISAMTECLLSPGIDQYYAGYLYSYDGMDRLLSATSRSGSNLDMSPVVDLTERMDYDVDSSIKHLIRRGKTHRGVRNIDSLEFNCNYGRIESLRERASTNILPGSFEIAYRGPYSFTYDNAGSLITDTYRHMNVSYDINSNPYFIAFNGGNETENGYSSDGVKLWTVHRTATGSIPEHILDNTNKPKPTPEIGNTASLYSRLSDNLIQSVDVTRYYDNFEFYDRNLSEGKFYFGNGYVSFHSGGGLNYSAIISDYRGSTRVVVETNNICSTGNIVQANSYYPSGALVTAPNTYIQLNSSSADVQTHKFLGKELDRMHGLDWFDLGARSYDAKVASFTSVDPLCEMHYHISPYAYCAGNPIKYIDPDGCDTLNITLNQGKWSFDAPIIAKGDDIFNVIIDDQKTTYTFSEHIWGKRVDALNLEITDDYTLGVYHVSGAAKDGTGYYVTPGGEPSTKKNSGKRIPEGIYPIITPVTDAKWQQPGVGGIVAERGCRFHYGGAKPRKWTEGCFVLSFDYSIEDNTIIFDLEQSKKAVQAFDYLLGGSEFYPYTVEMDDGTLRNRFGSHFKNGIDKKLILK